ncbi:MAG: hypothetical protein HDQ97_12135 [Lachnospiraceae bacterium]|nr:hypothetical protein [Lachnospiraceae bacterium]
MRRGRPTTGVPKEFIKEYIKFQSGEYGDVSKKQFAKLKGIPISTFYRYEKSLKAIDSQEKKELKTLADDFGLLQRKEVQEIIETC